MFLREYSFSSKSYGRNVMFYLKIITKLSQVFETSPTESVHLYFVPPSNIILVLLPTTSPLSLEILSTVLTLLCGYISNTLSSSLSGLTAYISSLCVLILYFNPISSKTKLCVPYCLSPLFRQ